MPFSALIGTIAANGCAFSSIDRYGNRRALSASLSTLLIAAIAGTRGGNSARTARSRVRQFHRLQHDDDGIDAGDAVAHRPVHPLVQARAMCGLEARRVDEKKLRRRCRHDAEDAMPRRLRLARRDRYARTDQCVDQRRFADVGPADDGDIAAAKRCAAESGTCHLLVGRGGSGLLGGAPARLPSLSPRYPSAGIRQTTSKVCRCASPLTATTA